MLEHHTWPDVVFALVVAAPGLVAAYAALRSARLSAHNRDTLQRQSASIGETAAKVDENTAITKQVKQIVNGKDP
jgi:hypothetical protein